MKNVEDIYPLSPMQEMMMLHVHTQDRQDVLFNQTCFKLTGELDEQALIGAWRWVMARHPALRSLFLFDGLQRPMQVVRQEVELPVTFLDWREHAETELPSLLAQTCRKDKALSFDAARAPLLRLTLARSGDNSYYLLWSSHHLVIDRWCTPIILRELVQAYRRRLEGDPAVPAPARPYRDYIRWIESRDTDKTMFFWRQLLAGYEGESQLTRPDRGAESRHASKHLNAAIVDRLREFCRSQELTLASLVQGAWALLLNRHCETQDTLFGVVSSGRPAELPEVESIVGSFINNLPVRIRLAADSAVTEWLRALQQQSRRRLPHEFASLAQIRSWCDLPPSQVLFDSLIVWLARNEPLELPGLRTEVISHGMGTAYPLSLYVEEGEQGLDLILEVASGHGTKAPLEALMSEFCSLLLLLTDCTGNQSLESLPGFRGALTSGNLESSAALAKPGDWLTATADAANIAVGRERPKLQMLEDLVAAQWRAVLCLDEVPRHADFFDLGGDSLLAASLADCLQTALSCEIPLLALFREPTVAGMAQLILTQDWPVTARVATAVKREGVLPPLFCVASPEVDTVGYAILARHLTAARPVYVLQSPPSVEGLRRLQPSEIPILAQTYIEAMREVQPRGPYNLLGMCSGSQIGIEICRKLEAQGDTVAFSGVVDTWALYTLSRGIYLKRALNLASYYAKRLRQLANRPRAARNGSANRSVSAISLPGGASTTTKSGVNDSGNTKEKTKGYSVIEEVGWPAQQPGQPKIASKVTVFRQRNRQQYWRIRDPQLGWGKHAQVVELVHLQAPGHRDIFREPWVRELAVDVDAGLAE